MLQCLLLVTNLARQYHCSSVCGDWFWARRPYWHHLLAQLSGLMCPHCHLITMIISPGELWVEQGLLCQRLGQGCLWQGGRVPGNICHNTRCILSQNIGPIKLLVYLVICQMLNHSSENISKFVWSIIEWLWWHFKVVLKEVSLPMVSDAQCLDWLRATRLGRRFRLDQSFVCAGGEEGSTLMHIIPDWHIGERWNEGKDANYVLLIVQLGKDACRGDGGGPLVCPKRDDPERFTQVVMGLSTFFSWDYPHFSHFLWDYPNFSHHHLCQVGIVAWGIGCGQAEVPGVYTSVAEQVPEASLDSK